MIAQSTGFTGRIHVMLRLVVLTSCIDQIGGGGGANERNPWTSSNYSTCLINLSRDLNGIMLLPAKGQRNQMKETPRMAEFNYSTY